MIKEITVKY